MCGGHAIETSSAIETASCFFPGRRPKRAVTDQPKIAWMMLPIFLPMKLSKREMNATPVSAAAAVPDVAACEVQEVGPRRRSCRDVAV